MLRHSASSPLPAPGSPNGGSTAAALEATATCAIAAAGFGDEIRLGVSPDPIRLPSAGFAGAVRFLGEVSERAVEAPSDV